MKTTSQDFLEMDLKAQSGSIWTEEKAESTKYNHQNFKSIILKPDPVLYAVKESKFEYKNTIKEFIERHKLNEMTEDEAVIKLNELINKNTGMSSISLEERKIAELLLS